MFRILFVLLVLISTSVKSLPMITDDLEEKKTPNAKSEFFYSEQIEKNLFFSVVKIADNNLLSWAAFSSKELKLACKWFGSKNSELPNICTNILSGTLAFNETFKQFVILKSFHPFDLWVVCASLEPFGENAPIPSDKIEMYYTISTAINAPFSSHVGISRGAQMIKTRMQSKEELSPHKNLSLSLHSFGASFIKTCYPEKLYMITTPMIAMREIMEKHFGNDKIKIALAETWQKNLESNTCNEHEISYYGGLLKRAQIDNVMSFGENFSNFILKNPEGKTILNLAPEQIEGEYAWYCNNPAQTSVNATIVVSLEELTKYQLAKLI